MQYLKHFPGNTRSFHGHMRYGEDSYGDVVATFLEDGYNWNMLEAYRVKVDILESRLASRHHFSRGCFDLQDVSICGAHDNDGCA